MRQSPLPSNTSVYAAPPPACQLTFGQMTAGLPELLTHGWVAPAGRITIDSTSGLPSPKLNAAEALLLVNPLMAIGGENATDEMSCTGLV